MSVTELYFNSEDALTYLSGGWLEEYAWLTCAGLHPSELKMNVVFTDDYNHKADLRNEMDVIIQHNNRLLMIECKTGRFGRHEQKDSDILNKLDSISDAAGGTFCSKMLLSAWQLDHETAEGRKVFLTQKAESRHIKVCQFKQLEQLADQVKLWMDSPFH